VIENLPHLNASLNATSALLLFCGWWAIKKQRNKNLHRNLMVSAFLVSTAFLISYLTFHFHPDAEPRKFGDKWPDSPWRYVYYAMLISHITLAIAIVPMIIRTFFLAIKNRLPEHMKFGKITLALWFYVSVTGVTIYFILYQL
jgi:putative membrane protein